MVLAGDVEARHTPSRYLYTEQAPWGPYGCKDMSAMVSSVGILGKAGATDL